MTPRSPTPMSGHCDRYGVTVASLGAARGRRRALAPRRQPISASRCILPVTEPVRPRRGPHIGTWERVPASFARPASTHRRCGRPDHGAPPADQRAPEEHRDLRRPNPELCGLRRGVHPLRRGPGVLPAEGLRQRPEALHQLPSQPARQPRWRLRRPRHRWPARLRARRRPPQPRVLRGDLLVLRQPGAGPFKPRMDRPVYCSDCFRTVKPD